jgi:hypothetical protein
MGVARRSKLKYHNPTLELKTHKRAKKIDYQQITSINNLYLDPIALNFLVDFLFLSKIYLLLNATLVH